MTNLTHSATLAESVWFLIYFVVVMVLALVVTMVTGGLGDLVREAGGYLFVFVVIGGAGYLIERFLERKD